MKIRYLMFFVLIFFMGCVTNSYNVERNLVLDSVSLVSVNGGSFKSKQGKIINVKPFSISQFEVTRSNFLSVMGYDPSDPDFSTGETSPVQRVSWYEAIVFCNILSISHGLEPVYSLNNEADSTKWGRIPKSSNKKWNNIKYNTEADGFRLPTESEFLWASMGGDLNNPGKVNEDGVYKKFSGSNGSNRIEDYAWTSIEEIYKSQPVGGKLPNENGIFDMSGNVWEWCWDVYSPEVNNNYNFEVKDDFFRVLLGSDWSFDPALCSLEFRLFEYPGAKNYLVGFRVARTVK